MHTAGASTDTTLQNMQLRALFYAAAQMAAALRQRKATFYTICFHYIFISHYSSKKEEK